MFRTIFTLLVPTLLGLTAPASSEYTCPPNEASAPCVCQYFDEPSFYCDENTDLKAVFDRIGPLVDQNDVFDSLRIRNQGASELPADTIASLKFNKITIENNPNLQFIHPDAFGATLNVTTVLHMSENGLVSNSTHHQLFEFLSKFKIAVEIDLPDNNQVRYIPDDPFPQVIPNLRTLNFGSIGTLDYVGARVFANLPALQNAGLGSCGINLDKLSPETFEGIGSQARVTMTWNEFSRLPENIFRPLLDKAAVLYVGGETCWWGFCGHERLDCDAEANWICEDVDFYEPKLDGFYCKEEIGVDHIWEYCASLKNSTGY